MLVDLVKLRREGKRLGRDAIRSAKPKRGSLYVFHKRRYGERIIIAGWTPENEFLHTDLLHRVTLVKWSGRNVLLEGQEDYGFGDRVYKQHPQSWWCRLVELPPLPAPSPGQGETAGFLISTGLLTRKPS